MVLWGVYSRQFVAFPLFSAPRGSLITSHDPEALTSRLREMEHHEKIRLKKEAGS
jgi:hypothetical protein